MLKFAIVLLLGVLIFVQVVAKENNNDALINQASLNSDTSPLVNNKIGLSNFDDKEIDEVIFHSDDADLDSDVTSPITSDDDGDSDKNTLNQLETNSNTDSDIFSLKREHKEKTPLVNQQIKKSSLFSNEEGEPISHDTIGVGAEPFEQDEVDLGTRLTQFQEEPELDDSEFGILDSDKPAFANNEMFDNIEDQNQAMSAYHEENFGDEPAAYPSAHLKAAPIAPAVHIPPKSQAVHEPASPKSQHKGQHKEQPNKSKTKGPKVPKTSHDEFYVPKKLKSEIIKLGTKHKIPLNKDKNMEKFMISLLTTKKVGYNVDSKTFKKPKGVKEITKWLQELYIKVINAALAKKDIDKKMHDEMAKEIKQIRHNRWKKGPSNKNNEKASKPDKKKKAEPSGTNRAKPLKAKKSHAAPKPKSEKKKSKP